MKQKQSVTKCRSDYQQKLFLIPFQRVTFFFKVDVELATSLHSHFCCLETVNYIRQRNFTLNKGIVFFFFKTMLNQKLFASEKPSCPSFKMSSLDTAWDNLRFFQELFRRFNYGGNDFSKPGAQKASSTCQTS